jgi:hypothetical protein
MSMRPPPKNRTLSHQLMGAKKKPIMEAPMAVIPQHDVIRVWMRPSAVMPTISMEGL